MKSSWPEEFILLALLRDGPEHGYRLHRRLGEDPVLSRIWTIKQSQMYFLLSKLVRRGWVRSARRKGLKGPPRTEFSITPNGRTALSRWLAAPVQAPRELRGAFVAKLYLAYRDSPTAARSLVGKQRNILRAWQRRHAHDLPRAEVASVVLGIRDVQTKAAIEYLDGLWRSHLFRHRLAKRKPDPVP
jgi:DNA-binding PadR family transcriptional regulator